MKVKITLSGDSNCSTIKECSEEQYQFLLDIEKTMGDYEDESYSPYIFIDKVHDGKKKGDTR
jgi:hypothetical protein